MNKKILYCLVLVTGAVLLSVTNSFAFGSYGNTVNTICAPTKPYTGDCALCHTSSKSAATPAKDAYKTGGSALTDFFCPTTTPTCTDNDGDTFSVEGGDCGPVDCNDNNSNIYPGAFDIPNNGIDEDCNGADSIDASIADNDGDGFTPAGGDCNDKNSGIHPGAFDIPNNGIDEDCDGADSIDTTLIDQDGDGFMPSDGDCDDADAAINPAALEVCEDGIDNDCDGLTDEDCNVVCPDVDGDGYRSISCGGSDCNDTDTTVSPGFSEICDKVDNNCNGLVDEGNVCDEGFWSLMLPVVLNACKSADVKDSATAPQINNPTNQPTVPNSGPVIWASAQGGGTVSPSGAVSVERGTSLYFNMKANAGYKLYDIVVDGESKGPNTSNRYLFLNVVEGHTIEGIFHPTITSSASEGGYIWPMGSVFVEEVKRLTNFTYTFTPMVGYHLVDVLVNGVSRGPVETYTFVAVTVPQTIEAVFAPN